MNKIIYLVSKICLTVFTFLFAFIMVAGGILIENDKVITSALGQ